MNIKDIGRILDAYSAKMICRTQENADNMKTFDTYEEVDNMRPCKKRPVVVKAIQINEPFRCNSLEGDYKQGKPGDYLITGVDGENYICDKDIFEQTYDFL